MRESPRTYHAAQLRQISARTIGHYDRTAEAFWQGTREHDVGQNYAALLAALEGEAHHSILDFGCGPGRDLRHFRSLGHDVIGLDGSKEFVAMARAYSGCEVLHQDFLALQLPANRFDGIFANASLFHVPSQELPRVLGELARTSIAKPGAIIRPPPASPRLPTIIVRRAWRVTSNTGWQAFGARLERACCG